MFQEIISLFERAGIEREMIGSTDVPLFNTRAKVSDGSYGPNPGTICVPEMTLCADA